MKRYTYVAIALFAVGLAFAAGYWANNKETVMQPGLVYEAGQSTGYEDNDLASPPEGAIEISGEKQRMIGVSTEEAQRKPAVHTLRVLGTVAPDENRLFRINTSTEVWIRKVYPPTTGSTVRKGEPLLAYYSPNFLTAAQSYLYSLDASDRLQAAKQDASQQIAVQDAQVRLAVEQLQNLGVSDQQIEEMKKTRKISDFVIVRSPTDGFVLSRTATQGQWSAIGTELYLIADLRRVWIFADLYENEARYLRPGVKVKVTYSPLGKTFDARVSDVPPIFDPVSRTSKVRLEAVNPGDILRPGMFVDVEMSVKMPPAVVVPSEAIIFSGAKKTVFVDLGNGYFQPREVQTGWSLGNEVEITKGLKPGERIVTSGNFLLDSESKLRGVGLGSPAPEASEQAAGSSQ